MFDLIDPAFLAKALPIVIVVNIAFSAVRQALDALKQQGKLPWLAAVSGMLQKVVDILSANLPHK